MCLYCDNKSAIKIAHNLVQHDQIKYNKDDKRETWKQPNMHSIYVYQVITTRYVN